MKIKHTDGTETDTDKLSDIDALVMEKAHELIELYISHKAPFLLVYQFPGKTAHSGGQNFNGSVDKMFEFINLVSHRLLAPAGYKIKIVKEGDDELG